MRAALRGHIEMCPVLLNLHTLSFGSVDRSHKAFLSPEKHNSDPGTIAFLILVNAPTVPLGDFSCASEDVTGIQSVFHTEMLQTLALSAVLYMGLKEFLLQAHPLITSAASLLVRQNH